LHPEFVSYGIEQSMPRVSLARDSGREFPYTQVKRGVFMKLSAIFSSLAMAGLVAGAAHADPAAAMSLQDALAGGKVDLSLRLRDEYVSDPTKAKEANAETLRTVLGYKTAGYHGLKAALEFENVTDFGQDYYNSTVNGRTQYAVIADPEVTLVNQAYLEGYGFRVGRQKIIFDNARFIGDVGWRQDDQTFDAVGYSNASLVKDLTVTLDYLSKVWPVSGVVRPVQAPLVNVRYDAFPQAKVTAFYYAVDEVSAPATSWQHAGLLVTGTLSDFLYTVSFAHQDDYADSKDSAATPLNADYLDLEAGYKFGSVTLKGQHEELGKGFKTPLATLHAFNGWADRFLTTPADGLQDDNLSLTYTSGAWTAALCGHDFHSDANGHDFGSELDAQVGYQLTKNLGALLKYAKYEAADTLNLVGTTPNKDLEKAWVQFLYKM
jgi:hypothetical protein